MASNQGNDSGGGILDNHKSNIVDFYNGRSVFITGGTGFIGGVLLEKILHVCDGIKNIYVLIRPKHGKTVQQRLDEIANSPLFQKVTDSKPEVIKKMIPIQGNLLEYNIGISNEDLALLQKEVSVVFHVGADISFDATVRQAVENNTTTTGVLLDICRAMPRLDAFIYVSTAYVNCNNNVTDEQVIRSDLSLETIFKTLESPDKAGLTNNLIGGRPNTYSYSKSLAEQLISQRCDGLPVAIVRPSIVISTAKDPMPGWMVGMSGPNAVLIEASKGWIKCWHGNPDTILDLVPVDYVVNLILAAAWKTHCNRSIANKDLKVYTIASGLRNPIKLQIFTEKTLHYMEKHSKNGNTNKTLKIIPQYFYYLLFSLFYHIIPGLLYDAILYIKGEKPMMKKYARRFQRLANFFTWFCLNQFLFIDNNTMDLLDSMNENDNTLFDFNINNLNWDSYLENYAIALLKY